MKFCVIRHPDVAGLGTCPETALDHQRALGWFRVSDWRDEASDFHLPDFADTTEDLDPPAETPAEPAPEPSAEPEEPTAKTSKEKKA